MSEQTTTATDVRPGIESIAFGGGTIAGPGRGVSVDVAHGIVAAALRAGVRFFDTASMYAGGESELILGEALQDARKDITLLTKGGVSYPDLTDLRVSKRDSSYDGMKRSLEASLQRLRTDIVDVFLIHQEDMETPPEQAMANLQRLVDDGLTRAVGFCNFGAEGARRALATGIPSYVEYSCSLFDRRYMNEFAAAKAAGGRRIGYGTFVHGLLAEDLHEDTEFPPSDWRHRARTAGDAVNSGAPFYTGDAYARYVRVAQELRRIGERFGVSLAVFVLALTLLERNTDLTLIGCRSVDELNENLTALTLEVDGATQAEVAALLASVDRPSVNQLNLSA
jgi:aryl-alcohol dehydrogenase-like predicted oxidoreductase